MVFRLLIADDSPLYRLRLSQIFAASDKLQIVGLAGNGREAISLIKERHPGVLLLDLEMPELDGFTVLRWTMQHAPLPVVVCSGHSERESVFEALEAGAVDFITKPQLRYAIRSEEFACRLRDRVEAAAKGFFDSKEVKSAPGNGQGAANEFARTRREKAPVSIVGIVGSAGGPAAVANIMGYLKNGIRTPILIGLHMPPGFTRSFADRLARLSGLNISEAHDGERIKDEHIYVATGGQHTTVRDDSDGNHIFELKPQETRDFHTPSADQLLTSVSDLYGSGALAVVLTGMGDDGLAGARAIKKAGGSVIVESRKSAVIWGMPRSVSDAGLADAELSQQAIANALQIVC